MTHDYFVLNELLVPRLVLQAALGRRPVVLHVWPLVPASRRLLERLVRFLGNRKLLSDPMELRPAWRRFEEKQAGVAAYGFYTDAYMKIEPTQDRIYDMAGLGERIPDYAQAVRHRICTHFTDLHWLIFALRDLGPADRVHGLPEEMRLYAARYAGSEAPYKARPPLQFKAILNTLTWLSATLYTAIWIFRHTVLRVPVRKRYQLGADLLQVLRHLYLTREMVDDDSHCLVVFRTPQFREMYKDRIGKIEYCLATDGCVPLRRLPEFLWLAVRDHAQLYVSSAGYAPSLYRRISTLPQWRVVYRALFARFDLERFLARDDYNGEHAVRTLELRRAGAMSLGVGHGLPTTNRISPVVRYLDFDHYFTFTQTLFERYYRETFSPQTNIVGVGSTGLTREGLARLGDPRPRDVLVYMSHDLEAERYMAAVQEIAARFPERKFVCKIKESQFGHGTADIFVDGIAAGPDNLVESREDSYLLMLSGRYGISNDSTIIAEAIGFGIDCFMYDVYDEVAPDDGHPSIYRNHPEICVSSAGEFEARIRALESGSWKYPREGMSDLVDLSGLNPFDRIRSIIGLAPKAPLEPIKMDAA